MEINYSNEGRQLEDAAEMDAVYDSMREQAIAAMDEDLSTQDNPEL